MKYDDFDRALLRAGRRVQAPTSRMRARALQAATAVGVATVATTTTAAAAKAGAIAKTVKLVGVLKLTLVALATVSLGSALYVRHVGSTERSVEVPVVIAPSVPERTVPVPPVTVTTVTTADAPETVASATPPLVITPASAKAPPAFAPPTKPTEASRASAVRDELDLVDPARQALANGDPGAAIRLADEHARRFPAGVFGLERDVIRIDALSRAGRAAEATARAREFLEQHPHAPQARRIGKLLDTNP